MFEDGKENNKEKKPKHEPVSQRIVELACSRKGKGKDYWGSDLRRRGRHGRYRQQTR